MCVCACMWSLDPPPPPPLISHDLSASPPPLWIWKHDTHFEWALKTNKQRSCDDDLNMRKSSLRRTPRSSSHCLCPMFQYQCQCQPNVLNNQLNTWRNLKWLTAVSFFSLCLLQMRSWTVRSGRWVEQYPSSKWWVFKNLRFLSFIVSMRDVTISESQGMTILW